MPSTDAQQPSNWTLWVASLGGAILIGALGLIFFAGEAIDETQTGRCDELGELKQFRTGSPAVRRDIASQAGACGSLDGMGRAEVRVALGAPDSTDRQKRRWNYLVGRGGRGCIHGRADHFYLALSFDEAGEVTDTEIGCT